MTKILVADDDTVMLGLLKTLLELEGHEVVSVIRQDEIITAVERDKPDMILMDFHLAGGNALNASGMDCKHECMEAGAIGFILKPFRPSYLIDNIRAVLEGNQV